MSFAQIQLISHDFGRNHLHYRSFWRYSEGSGGILCPKTTGILMGYLFLYTFLGLTCFSPFCPALAGTGVVLHHHYHQHTGL